MNDDRRFIAITGANAALAAAAAELSRIDVGGPILVTRPDERLIPSLEPGFANREDRRAGRSRASKIHRKHKARL